MGPVLDAAEVAVTPEVVVVVVVVVGSAGLALVLIVTAPLATPVCASPC